MISIQQPLDLISISLYRVLSFRTDEKFYNLVKDWNKTIVINVTEFYPVTVKFQGTDISFERGDAKKASLRVTMSVHKMLDMAYGRSGPYKAILARKLKIKGIYKIGTLLKFQKIFLNSMKMAAAQENQNYFEIEKSIK